MKKIFSFGRRRELSPSRASFPPRRDSGVRPFGPNAGYLIRVKDLGKIHKAASIGDVAKVQQLLLLGKSGVNELDKKNRTPLHLACANGYPDVVSLLVERKCKLNLLDNDSLTPLIKAVQCQQEECATILLQHGADTNIVDPSNNTALHYAASGQNTAIAAKLLRHKMDIEAKNKEGHTPLLLAITENNQDMVDFFLKNGANVNASDKSKRTALMLAVSCEPTGIVSLLLQYDIDLSCKDNYGWGAKEYAIMSGHSILQQLISQYGRQKAFIQPPSPKISSSKISSDSEFTLGRPAMDQEGSARHIPESTNQSIKDSISVGQHEDASDWGSTNTSQKNESYRNSKDLNFHENYPCQSQPETENQSGSVEFGRIPLKEEEAGAGSGPETGFGVVILGEKPVPQKQCEPQVPLLKEEEGIEDAPDFCSAGTSPKTESSTSSSDLTLHGIYPCQLLLVTENQSGSTEFGRIPLKEEEAAGAGSGPETGFRVVVLGEKPVSQEQCEPQVPLLKEEKGKEDYLEKHPYLKPTHPTIEMKDSSRNQEAEKGVKEKLKSYAFDLDSPSTSSKNESCKNSKDLNFNVKYPPQSLPVTKNQSGSTDFGKIPLKEDEAAGPGSGPETGFRIVILGEKPVSQEQRELQLPPEKGEGKEGSSEENQESFDKSGLEQDKGQIGADDVDDFTQSSDTPTEDYGLPPLNCQNALLLLEQLSVDCKDPISPLKIQDVLLRYDQSVKLKKGHCTLLTRKVKSLENKITGLQGELSKTREMKTQLEYQKAEWDRELRSLRFTLKQEEVKRMTAEMLFEKKREQLRRKEEQCSQEMELKQQLEFTLRTLDLELKTVRNHLKEVEEERNDTQRQLSQEQNVTALQARILNNLLWKQKVTKASVSKMTQTSKDPDSNEKGKYLLHKNQALQDEVAKLKLELDTVKTKGQEKENKYTEENEVLKEKNIELQKELKLNEEALTKTISQYNGQVNVLTTENAMLNLKLENEKQNRDRLETEIESYRSHLTSAIRVHERSQTSKLDLEHGFQRERNEWLRLQDKLNHDLSALGEDKGVLSQEFSKAESRANSLQNELYRVRDSLREKTLSLESTERELNQAQHKAKELEHRNQMEKEKLNKYIIKHESIQENLAQIQSENMLLRQQVEDAQDKGIIKEEVSSEIQVQFIDLINKLRADNEKQILVVEERNKELISERNHLREQMCKNENEKAEREIENLTEQLETVSLKWKQSESINRSLREELLSLKILQKKCDRLEENVRQLEEVVNLRHHLEITKTQAAARSSLEKLRENSSASIRNLMEQHIRYLESKMKNSRQEAWETELEGCRQLLSEELKARKSLSNRLDRTTEMLTKLSCQLWIEKEKRKILIANYTTSPAQEPSYIGNVNSSMFLSRNLFPRGNLEYSPGNPVSSESTVEAYLSKGTRKRF